MEICISIIFGSRPSRGAWIEIRYHSDRSYEASRRAPRGARGLKYEVVVAVRSLRHTVAPLAGRVD